MAARATPPPSTPGANNAPTTAGAAVPKALVTKSIGATLNAFRPAMTLSATPLSSASAIIRAISLESSFDCALNNPAIYSSPSLRACEKALFAPKASEIIRIPVTAP